jgi:hypothetical protein
MFGDGGIGEECSAKMFCDGRIGEESLATAGIGNKFGDGRIHEEGFATAKSAKNACRRSNPRRMFGDGGIGELCSPTVESTVNAWAQCAMFLPSRQLRY